MGESVRVLPPAGKRPAYDGSVWPTHRAFSGEFESVALELVRCNASLGGIRSLAMIVRERRRGEALRLRALERGTDRRIEERDDAAVVVRDGVHIVQREMVGFVRIVLRFKAREETPPRVMLRVRRFSVHIAYRVAIYEDHVRGDAGPPPRRDRDELLAWNPKILLGREQSSCLRLSAQRTGRSAASSRA